jgi:CheY-like chemotaxis protein
VARLVESAKRILVVDDDPDGADTLAMLLRLEGHEVHVAYAGGLVLQMALSLRPHVALLDIAMPDVSGLDAARALRGAAELRDLRLIAISGFSVPNAHQVASEAGFEGLLTKPINAIRLNALLS